eukprot:COSAG04_NODE_1648_length_6060_cov_2.273154_8_plen_137_part_00
MGARAGAVPRRSGGGGRTSLLSGLVLNEEFASPFFIPKQLTTPALSPTTTFCVERFDIGSSLSVFLLVDATCKRSQRESESSIGGWWRQAPPEIHVIATAATSALRGGHVPRAHRHHRRHRSFQWRRRGRFMRKSC